MGTYTLQQVDDTRKLVEFAQESDEPIILFDGDDECLIAMRPSVFERVLFDSDLLNCEPRDSLHF